MMRTPPSSVLNNGCNGQTTMTLSHHDTHNGLQAMLPRLWASRRGASAPSGSPQDLLLLPRRRLHHRSKPSIDDPGSPLQHRPHSRLLRPRAFTSSSATRRSYEFDAAMALEPMPQPPPSSSSDGDEGQEQSFRGHICDQWSFGDAPNGGILTSLAISAARKAAGVTHKDPLSVSTHFVRKARENAPAILRVRRLAAARSQETLSVALLQPDEAKGQGQEGPLAARAYFLMTFGTLSRFKGMDMNHLTPPSLPPVDDCIDVMGAIRRGEEGGGWGGERCAIADRLELHMPRDAPFVRAAFGPPSHVTNPQEPCVMEGWARLRDGRRPCLRSMALFNDGFPAPVHSHAMASAAAAAGRVGAWVWVPTVELTTHFWERPPKQDATERLPAPFLRVRFTTAFVRRGVLMCDSEVWDGEHPTLYSSSRQYARILVPRPASVVV